MTDTFYIITFTEIDETQRTLIQAAVKARAESWWHRQRDIWIVQGGGSAGEWIEGMKVFTTTARSSVLIFRLPEAGERVWAASAKGSETWAWIEETYSDADGKGTVQKAIE